MSTSARELSGSAVLDDDELRAVRADLLEGDLTPDRVAAVLRRRGHAVGPTLVGEVHARVLRDSRGLGPLQELVDDPRVTDVLVNGAGAVWVDRGNGPVATGVVIADEAQVRRLAQRLAALGGRRLDDAAWWCDVRLPGGIRCHAVLAPVARPGTSIALRVPRDRGGTWSLTDLRDSGMLTEAGERLTRRIVQGRLGYLVTGGTGAGKTTLLASMLTAVPASERVVVVEDSSELRPHHPQVVGLEARPANVEGEGAIDLRTLVRQALRMRPDRVVLGEVRGAEVVDLLAAMNTGHEGGCGTLHANSAAQVLARLEALASPAGWSARDVAAQVVAAVDVVLHVTRGRDSRRRLAEVAVPVRQADSQVRMEVALTFDAAGKATLGPGAVALEQRLIGGGA